MSRQNIKPQRRPGFGDLEYLLKKEYLDRVGGGEGTRGDEGGVQVRGGEGEAEEASTAASTSELSSNVQHKPLLAQPATTFPPKSVTRKDYHRALSCHLTILLAAASALHDAK